MSGAPYARRMAIGGEIYFVGQSRRVGLGRGSPLINTSPTMRCKSHRTHNGHEIPKFALGGNRSPPP